MSSNISTIANNNVLINDLPFFRIKDIGFTEKEYDDVINCNPERYTKSIGCVIDGKEYVAPVARSILYDLQYMHKMERRRCIRRSKTDKNNKKIYLDNHPKDSVISKNVNSLILADKINFNS